MRKGSTRFLAVFKRLSYAIQLKNELSFTLPVIPIIPLIGAGVMSIFYWKAGMHIPLPVDVISAAMVAMIYGWSWDQVQKMMVNSVARALSASFILLVIEIIVSTWSTIFSRRTKILFTHFNYSNPALDSDGYIRNKMEKARFHIADEMMEFQL